LIPVLFAATLFTGAALLFLVQPLVGKLLLPLVGGSPGVWNTCMVFFQVLLLGGYLYAHRSTGKLGVRRQVLFHSVLLAAVLISFRAAYVATGSPVAVLTSLLPDDQDYPIFGLVALLTFAVGIPFFVLSTTSPLLQRWFASTGCPSAKDPYFLYAASNAGSLLGLLGYPLLLEPRLTLARQQWLFAIGVCVYVGLVLACAAIVFLRKPATKTSDEGEVNHEATKQKDAGEEVAEQRAQDTPAAVAQSSVTQAPTTASHQPSPIPASRIGRWVFLSALPSSLLLGVTTHVSTNLAPVPLLWAVPLSLYLVSFILVFAHWPDWLHRIVGRITPILILFVVLSLLLDVTEPFVLIGALHLSAFFGVCLVCHGELARDRPPPEQLTAFYFWLSVGGVTGGLCNGLIAPVVFHKLGMVEYPLALILAAFARPRSEDEAVEPPLRVNDVVLVLVLLGISIGLVLLVPHIVRIPTSSEEPDTLVTRLLRGGLMFGLPAVAAFALVRRPARYALSLAALFVAGAFNPGKLGETLHMERNFYGVVRVTKSPDGKFYQLVHGTTIHGRQRIDEPGRPQPMSYYSESGPVGRLFQDLSQRRVKVQRVGVVGLGTGSVAHYAKAGQQWTFFEIDPAVARIAQNPAYFRFLSTCEGQYEIVLGDARRQLVRCPDNCFDLIILDGFCSDAMPVHLLTREAIALYFQKLTPGGVLAINVTNQHLDMPPLVARTARSFDKSMTVLDYHHRPTELDVKEGETESQWTILARGDPSSDPVLFDPYWWPRAEVVDGPIWRDDFANLLGIWRKSDD
jgi:hypothetical protein